MPQSEGYGGLKFCASVFVQGKPAKVAMDHERRIGPLVTVPLYPQLRMSERTSICDVKGHNPT